MNVYSPQHWENAKICSKKLTKYILFCYMKVVLVLSLKSVWSNKKGLWI